MEGIYHIKVDGSGFVIEISGNRDGYDKKLQNRKLFCQDFVSVDDAKKELAALKAAGYNVSRGENL